MNNHECLSPIIFRERAFRLRELATHLSDAMQVELTQVAKEWDRLADAMEKLGIAPEPSR